MGYKENYRGVTGGDFELMPAGEYEVKVGNSTIFQAKSSGKDTWGLELDVLGPRFAGRKLWLYHGMSEEAKPMRKGTITALGLNPEEDTDLINDVVGRKALAIVFHDTYNGEQKEKVKRLRSLKPRATTDDVFSDGQVHGGSEAEDVPF